MPGRRSIDSLTLLGFSLLRLGDRERAERAIDEVRSLMPDYPAARFFQVELAIRDGQYDLAEAKALDVLKGAAGDEPTIQQSLGLLARSWDGRHAQESRLATLGRFAGSFSQSPSSLAHLAREQFMADQGEEAIGTAERALEIAPGHERAARVMRRIGSAGWRRHQ